MVELNRAVAAAMASGPAQALTIVAELIASDRLRPDAMTCWPGSDGDRRGPDAVDSSATSAVTECGRRELFSGP
ncbi:hypothetical protein ACPSM1_18490 [Micromonospora chersina]|uniref:hypothetical protein n=1 Tax=Micromonospora chersina TaxID=47854 RepID=UPI003CA2D06D